jgi:uncharacterized membrane protein
MTPPSPNPGRQGGQIAVLTVVMILALLAVLGLVADGGLVFARHRELQATADAAARAGAAQLDEAAYRASNGHTARLNPSLAKAAAARHLHAAGFTGHTEITATADQVNIRLAESIRPPVFGGFGRGRAELAVRALARPRTGITQPQGP